MSIRRSPERSAHRSHEVVDRGVVEYAEYDRRVLSSSPPALEVVCVTRRIKWHWREWVGLAGVWRDNGGFPVRRRGSAAAAIGGGAQDRMAWRVQRAGTGASARRMFADRDGQAMTAALTSL